MIKNIIFDFGNVLIKWDRKNLYRKIFSDKDELGFFLEKVCPLDWNAQMDKGKSFDASIAERKILFPKYAKEIQLYKDRWVEMLNGAIDSNVAILKECYESNEFVSYGLTNWSAETFPIAQEHFEFLNWFEGIVVSGEEKLIKPGKEIYLLLLDRYNLKAEACVFIDDSKANIETAEELGIKGIHFTEGLSVKNELRKLNVL